MTSRVTDTPASSSVAALRDLQHADGAAAAQAAGLHYVEDDEPGYSRRGRGTGFSYLAPDGTTVTDPRLRERFAALAIPPAWSDVWISMREDAHLQATGRDDAGRKQYLYHPLWRELRDAVKFFSLTTFGHALPGIRRRVRRDLKLTELTPRKVAAAAVHLLDLTLIRMGNAAYAKRNGSYGLTSLRDRHVKLAGDQLDIRFRGKSGEKQALSFTDESLAEIVRECQELPGYELFRYRDEEGKVQTLASQDVNGYLHEATGEEVTAKEFRTWGATVLVAEELASSEVADADDVSERALKSAVGAAVEVAAAALGNTPTICRQSYVHPEVISTFLAGGFEERYGYALATAREKKPRELRLHEAATLFFLEDHR